MSIYRTSARYTLCIEGGNSNTYMKVIDQMGHQVFETKVDEGSNIESVGYEKVKSVLEKLHKGIKVEPEDCHVIAGMAGASAFARKEEIQEAFISLGQKEIFILDRDEMRRRLLNYRGVALVSGLYAYSLGFDGDEKVTSEKLGMGHCSFTKRNEIESTFGKLLKLVKSCRKVPATYKTLHLYGKLFRDPDCVMITKKIIAELPLGATIEVNNYANSNVAELFARSFKIVPANFSH